MTKTLAMTFACAALALSACAPAPEQSAITDQNYGGKISGGAGGYALAFRGCPDWAPKLYRGDLYCLDN